MSNTSVIFGGVRNATALSRSFGLRTKKCVTDIRSFLIVLSAPISIKAAMAKLIITIMTVVLLTQNCYAQAGGGGSGGGRKQHQQKTDKPTAQTPKADEKAYNAALKSLPNKPFDPWRGAR
jgi:hypothetical protein